MTDLPAVSVEPTSSRELVLLSEAVTSENSFGNDESPAGEKPPSAELLSTLEACRTRFQATAGRYRADIYDSLVPTYEVGLCLRSDKIAWAEFQAPPWWKLHMGRKPKLEDQDDALFFAVMSVFGGTSRAANQKARAFSA